MKHSKPQADGPRGAFLFLGSGTAWPLPVPTAGSVDRGGSAGGTRTTICKATRCMTRFRQQSCKLEKLHKLLATLATDPVGMMTAKQFRLAANICVRSVKACA